MAASVSVRKDGGLTVRIEQGGDSLVVRVPSAAGRRVIEVSGVERSLPLVER